MSRAWLCCGVLVKSDGTVGAVEVKSSSGYPRLDQAALDAVKTWRFNPAARNGKTVDEWYQVPVPFKLQSLNQQTDRAQYEEPRRLEAAQNTQSNLPHCQDVDVRKWHNCFGTANRMGETYAGEFKKGERNGYGVLIGQGTFSSAKASKYVGQFKDDKKNGEGINTSANGVVEEGIWEKGVFVRAEKINLPNQQTDSEEKVQKEELEQIKRATRYEEEIKRFNSQANVATGTGSTGTALNEANGQSKLPYCGGSYSRSWNNCFGTETFRSGSKYVGGYKDGLQNGQGIYTHFNGNKYLGEFEGGNFHGKGTYTYADGHVEEGIWVNNQLVRAEKLNLPNQQTDLALNEERRRLEVDRLALAEQQRRFDEEKRNREQARSSQRINLDVTHTPPDAEGDFTISIQAHADTASVKINGEELGGREDGQYTVRKVARAGKETIFTITAKDLNGNTDSKSITVSRGIVESSVKFAALNPAQVKRQPARDAVAIIIGIADYTNLPKAEYANDDARVFYDYAIRGLGVKAENIKLLIDTDADEIAIYQAFKTWLPSRVRSTTDVYVYYSGHGLPAADGQGLYLLPLGAHRDLIEKTAISQQEINGYLQLAKPKSVTIFLDSCYSGLTRTGQTLVASARPLSLKAETKIFPPNFTVISASQSDQISSSSPDLQHGIFSYFLMKGMEGDADANRDGKITLGEMLEYLTEQVARQASMVSRKQQPQLLGDANKVLVGQR